MFDMPSRFPGMDPYLERHWLDVHAKLVGYAADDLNSRLPPDLVASIEERVAIESDAYDRFIGPDIRVTETPPRQIADSGSRHAAVATLPFRLVFQDDPITERFIRVIEVGSERLITVLEFVSPTNKRGKGLAKFKAKRAELLESGVNFVEIDLVRAGNWRALLRPHRCPLKALATYRFTIRVPTDREATYLQPAHLRERLPDIPVPLRGDEPPVILDLQSLVDRAYDNGRYRRRLDYSRPLDPPLDPDDAAWASDLILPK
jgi:Protein of unknown function (DUF4058)